MGRNQARGLKALAEGSLAIAKFHTILDKTEKRLELEIARENKAPPETLIGKARHRGEKVIHSKPILFCVIILNVIDCILVLGELILDMYYVKGLLESSEAVTTNFIVDMKALYPIELKGIKETDVEPLFEKLIRAHIDWGHNEKSSHLQSTPSSFTNSTLEKDVHSTSSPHDIHKRAATENDHNSAVDDRNNTHGSNHNYHDDHHAHSLEEELAHAFHKASISILAILAIEKNENGQQFGSRKSVFMFIKTLFKIFAYGKRFLERKLEVFDCVIVFGSLFVDIYFLKGISAYKIEEFVIILAFLVPWRVIRVVNSLVVAVIDHEHFRLKLLYKQKKEISNDLKKTKTEHKNLQQSLDIVKRLAIDNGVPEQKISKHLALLLQDMGKHKKKGALAGFGHSFPLFHHHSMKPSPKSSPKMPHSSPNVLRNVEGNSNGSLMAHDSVSENGNINSFVNNGYVTDGDDVKNVNDVAVYVPNNTNSKAK